ncbi:MAG TPA: TonB-dependent receptor [Bacteroidales bacterium]|nr:TonB-dependent receptor [Bacteroidales bacterium]HQQ02676.1 TonB-dependent receptor [Bacteroidales bacterium]
MRKLYMLTLLIFGLSIGVMAQQVITIKGQVKNKKDGTTIPGVTVLLKGTTTGTVTDIDGNYTLNAPNNGTLVFSFVGMKVIEEPIQGRSRIDVEMEPMISQLEEVVVVGYGSTKKMDLTGSITTVSSDKLNYQPAANFASVLQGKVAGVQVTNSGAPGAAPVIRIRGLGTVTSKADPLYVVDGVITDNISFLSPTDIESTTILKDASASAIYGVKAANGVVIITTKRSTGLKAALSYSGYVGFQTAVNKLPLANNTQYIELINEKNKLQAEAAGQSFTPLDPANFPDYTDWYDEVMRDQAFIMNHDVGVSGGSENSSYYFGAGYFKQEGLLLNQTYERLNLRSSLDSKVNDALKVGYSATFSTFRTNDAPSVFYNAYVAPPVFKPKVNDTTFTNPVDLGLGNFGNPAASLYYYNSKSNGIRLVGSVFAEVNFLKYFQFRSQYGTDLGYARNRNYTPYYWVSPTQKDTNRTLSRQWTYDYKGVWDNTLTFENNFGPHRLKVMAGMSAQQENNLGTFGSRLGVPYLGENTLYINLGRAKTSQVNDWGSKITSLSYFGRINYSLFDRYLLTTTLRYDGSSVFPKDDRWDIFPSVGLGWIITGEEFMKQQRVFDYLKLRASWGVIGNNKIPANVYTLTVEEGGILNTAFGSGQNGNTVIVEGANITSAVPPQLKWEKMNEIDIALEGKSLNSRLSYEIDFYSRTTKDAIFLLTLSATAGTSGSYYSNNADILNQGIEVTLGWTDKVGKFGYDLNLNYAYNHNEVKKLREGTLGLYGGNLPVGGFFSTYTIVGMPIGSYYGRQVIGIFQNQSEVDNYVNSEGKKLQPNAKPGDFKYADVDGNGVIDNKDRIFLGNAIPKSQIGFSANLSYSGFDFTVDLYARWGNKIYNAKRAQRLGNENYDLDFYENRWHGEGTSNEYPSADLTGDNMLPNSWYFEDGAFLRVRTIQLGYTIPQNITKKIGISNLRVYVNATNPINLFGYNGFNPEIPEGSTTSQGIDLNVYPMSATYNFGINMNL